MYYLAVDIGASSGRHILCEKVDGKLILEEVYRFENSSFEKNGHSVWDMEGLFSSVVKGIKRCRQIGKLPVSMAIDTWGVDFALIDKNGNTLGDVTAYRDDRTIGMDALVEKTVPFDLMYAKTGIQKQSYNTVYQLEAIKRDKNNLLAEAATFLMIPEYLNYLLTGNMLKEYTQATTTGLVNAREKAWDSELISTLGYNKYSENFFSELHMPGEKVGRLKLEIQKEVGFDLDVVLCPSHDTASAFMAVPAVRDDSVYISSGTWSLLGVENSEPLTGADSMEANFTNEGGYNYRFRYLKNIMGLWMIQSVRRDLEKKYSFQELEELARLETGFVGRVSVNDNKFLAPKSMIAAVTEAATVKPENIGQLMECIYRSLADCYRDAIIELESLTQKKYSSINIVGGGSRDSYLNTLTSEATGLPVYAGPTEGTAIGNLMSQMIEAKEFTNLQDARAAVRRTFPITKYSAN